jgi:hypothetical protein
VGAAAAAAAAAVAAGGSRTTSDEPVSGSDDEIVTVRETVTSEDRGGDIHMLTDEEINAGASDVPLGATESTVERDRDTSG